MSTVLSGFAWYYIIITNKIHKILSYNKYSVMSLKDFVILSKLGEGAYSSVYKVQRIVDSQHYALKKVKMNNLSEK